MRLAARFAVIYLMLASAALAEVGGYVTEIEKWRENFDADVRTGGWLALVGRSKIDQGSWTLGSDPGSAVVLPSKAPARIGVLSRRGRVFRFEPAKGVETTIGGKAVSGSVELHTEHGSDRLCIGDLSIAVRAVGDDYYALVSDAKNPAIGKFKGTTWFPIVPTYHVPARFVPYRRPRTVHVPLTHVDSRESMRSTGDIVFRLAGKTYRLKTFTDEDELFVMFQDATNGKRSYGGGRFVYAPKPEHGVTVLDFNKAFNPYCSLNAYVMCPIPPPENRLPVQVAAGETFFAP
ncbi:MAG TPA: DUF1684 domain-containing protein [Steroidobacteraceae bacterium]|nr:DUF1684 domain-containing protein [Steroidobacteraceae bacterium]